MSTPETEGMPPDPFVEPEGPRFILYFDGAAYEQELEQLAVWVEELLIPVYGREVSSTAMWCPRWWAHPEAVARLHALYLAWMVLTGEGSELYGPAMWHRDYLDPTMAALRSPDGPFAGCTSLGERPKHRVLEAPRLLPVGQDDQETESAQAAA